MRLILLILIITSFAFGQYTNWEDKTAEQLSGITSGSTNIASKSYWTSNAYAQLKVLFDIVGDLAIEATDTTQLKAMPADTSLKFAYLKQLASGNAYGGGLFVYADSAYPIYPGLTMEAAATGKQWVRQAMLDEGVIHTAWVGLKGDSTDCSTLMTTAINAALNLGKPIVKIDWGAQGDYVVDTTIALKNGIIIDGGNNGADTSPTFWLKDNANCDMFANDSSVASGISQGGLQNLRLQGNRANNTSGSGVRIYKASDQTFIRRIQASGFAESGIVFIGSFAAPGHIEYLSLFTNKYGMSIESAGGPYFMSTISGDANDTCLVRVYNSHSAITINSIKAEATSGSYHKSVVYLDSMYYQSALHINGIHAQGSVSRTDAIIRSRGGGSYLGKVKVEGIVSSGYQNIYINETTNDTIANSFLGNRIGSFMYNWDEATYAGSKYVNNNTDFLNWYDTEGNANSIIKMNSTDDVVIKTDEARNITLRDSSGTNYAIFGNTEIDIYKPFDLDTLATYIQMEEVTAPGNPGADHARLYLQLDGSNNPMLLIKFSSGDVDTLAIMGD